MEKEKNIVATIVPILIVLAVYLIWIKWDYKTILPQAYQIENSKIKSGAPTPQIWSGHKVLNGSALNCAEQGKAILEQLNFKRIVINGSYVYGNYQNNRAAVKCVTQDSKTFMYAIAAGEDVKIVEQLRNKIVQGID